jgi:hypothetical protein
MYLYYVPEGKYPARTDVAKKEWGENGLVPYQPYIAHENSSGNCCSLVMFAN